MKTSEAFVEQERQVIVEAVRGIVSRKAPEEVDLLDTIAEGYFESQTEVDPGHVSKGQMFSFGTPEIQTYLTSAILFVFGFIVIPFLRKALETAVENTAEKSVEGLAGKIRGVLAKLERKNGRLPSDTRIDILVPVNWTELDRQIRRECQEGGFSRKRAREIAQLTVRELSDDQVLLGKMALAVMRIPLDDEE